MKSIYSKKRYFAYLLSFTMLFTMMPFPSKGSAVVHASGGEAILDLDNINQNPAINFSALKTTDGKMIISNDATTGGVNSSAIVGTTNTSYLLTPNKISGDFSVETTLKVTSRTIDSSTNGVIGIGAFSGTSNTAAMVTAVARSDKGIRGYYQKIDGTFGAGSPNIAAPASAVGTSMTLKLERIGGTYTATINGTASNLSGLNATSSGDMYLGFIVSGAVAEVSTFVIKQDTGKTTENVLYDLSVPALPRPTVTTVANGGDVDLSWKSVEGATSYSAEYANATGTTLTWNAVEPTTTTGSSITVKGLISMTPYNFRVKVNGGPSNNLYSAAVMAIPGFDWSTVVAPNVMGSAISSDGTTATVNFNMIMGALGATKVDVEMSKPEGTVVATKSITEVSSVLGVTSGSVKFIPTESGTYTFTAKASRNGESIIKISNPYTLTFDLPVAKPLVRTTAVKTGSIKVSWDVVKEADSYKVEYKKSTDSSFTTAINSTTALLFTIDALEVGTSYDFVVTAFKGVKFTSSAFVTAIASEVIGEVFDWKSIIFGQSSSVTNNSISVDNANNTVTVVAGSKDGTTTGGKITGSHDGISYYYTEIDPSKNFDLSATIKVNYFAKATPDNQEGFGIMARDAIGTNLDATVFASNMVMVGGYRGLVQSVFRNNVKDSSGAGATMDGVVKYKDRPANDGTATYKMTMKKTNTGYQVSVDNGKETIYYRPKQLEVLDSGKIYVGFFAARVASITVSNIVMKTSEVAADAPGIPEPAPPVTPSINLVSLSGSAISNYDFSVLSNIKGTIQIKQNGTELYNNLSEGNKILTKNTTLVSGDNIFDVLYTPDPTENITSPSPISAQYVVTYKNYGTAGGAIYVSPSGIATSIGTLNDPIDVYSALKFIGAVQTIYARGGTYNLTTPIVIEKGNDGTSDKLKVLSAYANEKPIFDFGGKSNGFLLSANYWKIYGINITKASSTGFRIGGNHNLVEIVNTYANGDTGLQVSGISTDPKENWPTNNLILNCTSYDNKDAAENNADGFAAKLTCGVGNVFRGCISHNNCDDGWDLYSKLETGPIGAVTIENCIAYGNGTLTDGTKTLGGGNGFKLGGEGLIVKHLLRNSLSYNNKSAGITSNSDPAITVENCTSVDNGKSNFDFESYATATPAFVATNDISFRTLAGVADKFPSTLASEDNYFYNGTVSLNASGKQFLPSDFNSVVKPAEILAAGITSVRAPSKDAANLTLPTVADGYTIAIESSTSTPAIIAINGTIAPPKEDTTVALVFEITKISDNQAADTASINVVVPSKTMSLPISGIPARPVLSDNNGYANGLKGGTYNITMNLWWGVNGTQYKLYEDGVFIDTKGLIPSSPNAQTAVTLISGKQNGTHKYYCELVNDNGTTASNIITVNITEALPGKTVLSNDNWDGDGYYKVNANMWWGTNATDFKLYENGKLIDIQSLKAKTPEAQGTITNISDRELGTYNYYCEFINEVGVTTSNTMIVKVIK